MIVAILIKASRVGIVWLKYYTTHRVTQNSLTFKSGSQKYYCMYHDFLYFWCVNSLIISNKNVFRKYYSKKEVTSVKDNIIIIIQREMNNNNTKKEIIIQGDIYIFLKCESIKMQFKTKI